MLAEITLLFVWTGGLTLTYLTSQSTNDNVINAMLRCLDFLLQVVQVVADVAFLPVSIALSLPWVWVLRLSFLSSIGLLVHQSPILLLETLDKMWRSVVYPFVQVGMLNVLMVFRFVFGTFAPLYNFVVVINAQIRTASLTLAGKCSIGNIKTSTRFITQAIVSFLTVTSKFMVNPRTEYNITQPIWELQQAVHIQSETAQCMCLSLSQPFEVLFGLTKSPSLARGINAGFNTGVSLLQKTVDSALNPMQAPDFFETFIFMKKTSDHFGEWMDGVLIDSSKIMLGTDVEFPQEFVFLTASHLVKSVVEVANVAVGTTANIVWRTKEIDTMIRVTSLQYAFEEMDFFVDGTGTIVTWVLNNVLTVIDQVCTDTGANCPDLSSEQSVAAGDLVRWSGRSLLGVPYVATNLINELMWRWNEKTAEEILKMLQDHDGKWGAKFDRRVVFGNLIDESQKPSLNRNVFDPLERLIDAFMVFVPKDIKPLKAIPRSALQLLRIAIRVILSGNHIIEGTFSKHPINHDYGTDEKTNGVRTRADGQECTLTKGQDCECMFVFPDDNIRTEENLQKFYGSSDSWCNSLLYEFVFKELDDLLQGLTNMIKLLTPSECTTRNRWQGEPKCEIIEAYDNSICAVSDVLGAASRVPLNLFRHVYAIIITEFFDVDEVHFHYENRLCDFSQLLYKALSVLPFTEKKPYVDAAYSLLRALVESQRAVVYFVDFLSGKSQWDEILTKVPCNGCQTKTVGSQGFVTFVMVELHLFFSYFVTLFDTFAVMFDDQGFQSVFMALAETTRLIKKAVSQELIETFALVVQTTIDLFLMLFSGAPSPTFVTNIGKLLEKFVSIMLTHVPTIILDLFFKMLGPVGTVLKDFIEELKDSDVIKVLFGASVGSDTTMMDIYDIGWHGTSQCDTMIHAYRHYTLGDMRPIEHLTVLQCVEDRELAVKLGEVIGIELPHDMFYNWQRKFEMLYSGTSAGIVYYKHHSSKQLVQEWKNRQLHNYWLQIFAGTGKLLRRISLRDFVDGMYHSLGYKPHIATFINVVDDTLDTIGQIRDAWTYHNVSHSWKSFHSLKNVTYTLGASAYQLHNYVVVDVVQSPSQYAWGLNSDPTIEGNCALVNNFNKTVREQLQIVQDYYKYDYIIMVDEFMAWFQGRDPWVTDFAQEFERNIKEKFLYIGGKILTPEGFLNPLDPDMDLRKLNLERLKQYFTNDFESFDPGSFDPANLVFKPGYSLSDFEFNEPEFGGDAPTNPRYDNPTLLVSDNSDNSKNCVSPTDFPRDIVEAIGCFVTETGDNGDLRYFGHNLRYIVDYQFQKCSVTQIRCDKAERVPRLSRMVDAFWYCLITVIVAVAVQMLLGIPTMMYIPLPIVFFFIFATHVWNWTYNCSPNVPICLADDIYYFVEKFLVPDCFCTYFPSLAGNCIDGCNFVSNSTTFTNCTQGEFGDHFGYMWVSFFYAKRYIPGLLDILGNVVYESHFQSLLPLVSEPNTQRDLDCAQLHVLDLSYPLLGTLVLLYALPKTFVLILRLSTVLLNLVLAVANLIYSMFLSLDETTIRASNQS